MKDVDAPTAGRASLLWFLVVCLVGVTVFFRWAEPSAATSSGISAPKDRESHPGDIEAQRSPRSPAGRLGINPPAFSRVSRTDDYLRPGDDFAAIERRLADRVADDPRALYVVYHAALVCYSPLDPEWRTQPGSEAARAYSSWKASFCHGRITADQSTAYRVMTGDALHERNGDSNRYFEAALNSDSPEDTAIAADMATAPGFDTWPMGLEAVEGTAYRAKLPRYQQVALQDIQCSEVGGCDAGGLMSTWLCMSTPGSTCRAGVSIEDRWADEFTPEEVAIIAHIQRRILDERASRATR